MRPTPQSTDAEGLAGSGQAIATARRDQPTGLARREILLARLDHVLMQRAKWHGHPESTPRCDRLLDRSAFAVYTGARDAGLVTEAGGIVEALS